ncbi:MAG: AMP-binding protein [Halioglobus sp.]|nr:AMP-binding protein [Halioglobus sp.]
MNQVDLNKAESRNFPAILRKQSVENGYGEFLITDQRRLTFADVETMTSHLAGGLRQLGVEPKDRVALMLGNDIEMVLLALAINKLGAVWTPINSEYKGDWLLDNLLRCRYKVLVVDASLQNRVAEVQIKLGSEPVVLVGDIDKPTLRDFVRYESLLNARAITVKSSEIDYGDTCSILWTSGTTGKSKGVMQSYNCWIRAIVYGASKQYNSEDGDIIYNTLPLYHSAAWITGIYRALLEGIPCVIEQKFSVTSFWQRISQFKATQTFVLGAMGVFLLNAPEKPEDAKNTLKTAGVVPLSAEQRQRFEQRFGLKITRGGLGQSECLLVCNQLEERDDIPLHALGFSVDDSEVCLMDDEGLPVAGEKIGEICVKPLEPYVVFNGYFDDAVATREAFFGEWYRTGDLGRQDPVTGALFFVDRKKDAIRYAGRNISTMEVESVAIRHAAVREVAAFGIPLAEVSGEHELKLNVVLQGDSDLSYEDLAAFINENAPHYFVPRYMDFVDSLPMTPTNKVQKFKLREAGVGPSTWDLNLSSYQIKR